MAKPRNKWVDYLQYLAVRVFAMFVHMFPVERNYRTARWLGEILWRVDRRHRRIAREHLRLSFPDWPQDRIDRVARRSMHNMAYLAVEVMFTPKLITPTTWKRHVRLVNMAENLRLLIRRQSGLIVLSGHFGNWEIPGYLMATLGFPVVSVARPLDNPLLNEFLLGVRERTGQMVLGKKVRHRWHERGARPAGHAGLYRRPGRRAKRAVRGLFRPAGEHVSLRRPDGRSARGAGGGGLRPEAQAAV